MGLIMPYGTMENNITLFECSLQNFAESAVCLYKQCFHKRQTRGNLSEGRGNNLGRFPYGCLNIFAVQGSLLLVV